MSKIKDFFQFPYEFFRRLATPEWINTLLLELQKLMWQVTMSLGRDLVDSIKKKIVSVSNEPISNEDKFKKVFDYARDILPDTKERYIKLIIEILVNFLKEKTII